MESKYSCQNTTHTTHVGREKQRFRFEPEIFLKSRFYEDPGEDPGGGGGEDTENINNNNKLGTGQLQAVSRAASSHSSSKHNLSSGVSCVNDEVREVNDLEHFKKVQNMHQKRNKIKNHFQSYTCVVNMMSTNQVICKIKAETPAKSDRL